MTGIPPTWTWGSSTTISMSPTLGHTVGAQLAQVTLPEPAVCTIYMQATATITNPSVTSIAEFTVNLNQGIGRVTIPRQVSFAGQPSVNSPLEWTMAFVPLHALNVDVEATGDFLDLSGGQIDVQIYLLVSPITRIPMAGKMEFGMSLPGEADALDDELRGDLEDESPTTQEVMSQEANHRVHGDAAEDDDENDDAPQQVPAWMLELVDALSQRLGRVPTRKELRSAVSRMRERAARKAR